MAMARQQSFEFPTWGGRRAGSGRKARRARPAIAHRAREEFGRSQPVHVTLRMADHVWNLRSQRSFTIIHDALVALRRRDDLRITEFSTQGNHVHLIVEADGPRSLANGIRALSIRVARRLNRMMGRRGAVFEDRYHTHVLRTPAEVRNALRYVRGNYASHAARRGEKLPPQWMDPYASGALTTPRHAQGAFWPEPVTREAETWLQRTARWGRPAAPSGERVEPCRVAVPQLRHQDRAPVGEAGSRPRTAPASTLAAQVEMKHSATKKPAK